jgi:hypothetical protein
MAWPLKKKQPRISKLEMISAIPVRNSSLEFREGEGKTKIDFPPLTGWRAKFLAFFFQAPKRRSVELDELGSEFLAFCDGKRQVGDVIKLVREEYQLSWKEAEVSTLAYLRELGGRGVVGMAVTSQRPGGEKS